LLHLCREPALQYLGIHECEFCPSSGVSNAAIVHTFADGERLVLGTAVIRVRSRDGREFAAPTLICHYIKVHSYQPPFDFIEAVMETICAKPTG
jgi:hypothetical protein